MKNIVKLSVISIFIIITSIVLTGCKLPFIGDDSSLIKLETPSLTVNVDDDRIILETESNENATYYQFGVYSGFEYNRISAYIINEVTENSFDVTDYITDPRTYYFYVRLIGDNEVYSNSDISEIESYENVDRLQTPILTIEDYIISWIPILFADEYNVYINNELDQTITETSLDISTLIDTTILQEYFFEVNAVFNEDENELDMFYDSFRSNRVYYLEHLKIDDITGLNIVGTTLMWDDVNGALEYIVRIDNETFTVQDNFFDFQDYLINAKKYELTVEVVPEGSLIAPSIAEPLYYDNYIELDAPLNVILVVSNDNIEISWDHVDNALSYSILIDGHLHLDNFGNPAVILTNKYSIPLSYYSGDIEISVKANGYSFYLDSPASEYTLFEGYGELEAPLNLAEAGGILTWDEVFGAETYKVFLNNYSFEVSDTSFVISDNAPYDGVFQARVKAKATYNIPSNVTNYIFVNNTSNFKENFTDRFFFYNGFNDFYITSQDDLDMVVFYAITNNIEELEIYVDIDSSLDIVSMHLESINRFPESKSFSYFAPLNISGNKYKLEYTFGGPDGPIHATGFDHVYQKDPSFMPRISNVGRDENFNDFKIYESLMETYVNNTNMLYNALQMGVRPLFEDEESIAYIIYEMAKDILRDIIYEDMNDYQKVLAIHDYIVYTTHYDRELRDLVLEPGFDPHSITLYDAFFIEGVFINNKAVCDGIAKAFSLLAGIEGIPSLKISGTANSSNTGQTGNDIGHAWNKVYIDVDGLGKNWFIVDATWNIKGIIVEDVTYEILSHEYFLLTDNDVLNSHFSNMVNEPEANYSADYFEIQSWYDEVAIKINSQGDLNDLIDYVIDNEIGGLEFSMSGDVSFVHSSINIALDGRITSFRYIANPQKEIHYLMLEFD